MRGINGGTALLNIDKELLRPQFVRPVRENEPLLSVAQALSAILASTQGPLGQEDVALDQAFGRTLAKDLSALRTQPSKPLAAMDGYALRAADSHGDSLHLIGEAAAGRAFEGELGPRQCIRIFTGAPMPVGGDCVLMQERARREGDCVKATAPIAPGVHVRSTGIDFFEGQKILSRGRRLTPSDIALAAAADHPIISLVRRPRVAVLANGDELVLPGRPRGPDQIVASNHLALIGMIRAAGAIAIDFGIVADDLAEMRRSVVRAREEAVDVLVTIGGASVGDHDLIKSALANEGMELGFWRIAMKPGKPLIYGRLGPMTILGLPGNPVSAVICAELFLSPLIRTLCGDASVGIDRSESAYTSVSLEATGFRQEFLRATLSVDDDERVIVNPDEAQDSSLISVLARSQALIIRMPYSPATQKGDRVKILRLSS
jgi:molybdopterin molybdotransferase